MAVEEIGCALHGRAAEGDLVPGVHGSPWNVGVRSLLELLWAGDGTPRVSVFTCRLSLTHMTCVLLLSFLEFSTGKNAEYL
eukprot:61274-Prorocentrum_minimum.AAC.1